MAVNDRSSDATGRILDDFAAADRRIKPLHIRELPAGWLGKPHALYEGYKASNGDWLLFTDADVRFRPDVLRRAMKLVHEQKLDHVTLLADAEMHGFWETALLTFFGLMFHLGNNVPAVGNPHSRAYVGVGAFQLMSRKAYEASGTHRRLALEVIDDMKLAKIVKQAGFRSGAAVAGEAVVVRWHAGLRNLIRGTTKNFFAAFGYRLSFAIVTITGLLVVNVLPFVGVVLGDGWVRVLCATCVAIALAFHVGVDWAMRVSPLYALTYPLGALFFTYMVMRSIAVTLWQGGVTWRETFYPLEELKRGVV